MTRRKTHVLLHILLLGLLTIISTSVAASEGEGMLNMHMVQKHDGLVTAEPKISQQELNHTLSECQHLLNARTHKLEEYIEENRITAGTGVVVAVMPGGLIYLAVRKSRLSDANTKLETLQSDMHDLQKDVLALHKEESPVRIARFP